jgi:hypothetical protein
LAFWTCSVAFEPLCGFTTGLRTRRLCNTSRYALFTSEGSAMTSKSTWDSLSWMTEPKSVSTAPSCLVPQEIYVSPISISQHAGRTQGTHVVQISKCIARKLASNKYRLSTKHRSYTFNMLIYLHGMSIQNYKTIFNTHVALISKY